MLVSSLSQCEEVNCISKALFNSSIPLEKSNHHFTQLLRDWFLVDWCTFKFYNWFVCITLLIQCLSCNNISQMNREEPQYHVRDSFWVKLFTPRFQLLSPWHNFQICGCSLGLFSPTLDPHCLLGCVTLMSLPGCLTDFSNSVCLKLSSSFLI